MQTFSRGIKDLRVGDLDAIWTPVTSPMLVGLRSDSEFDADPNAESVPEVVLHMPRARSHGMLRFPVARRVSTAYTHSGFSSHVGASRMAIRSRRAQRADDGLWVTLDYGQVSTNGDLRTPASLLPVLK